MMHEALHFSLQSIEEMSAQITRQKEQRGDSENLTKRRQALEADMFKLLCYEAETVRNQLISSIAAYGYRHEQGI
jgi:hypothetical protein